MKRRRAGRRAAGGAAGLWATAAVLAPALLPSRPTGPSQARAGADVRRRQGAGAGGGGGPPPVTMATAAAPTSAAGRERRRAARAGTVLPAAAPSSAYSDLAAAGGGVAVRSAPFQTPASQQKGKSEPWWAERRVHRAARASPVGSPGFPRPPAAFPAKTSPAGLCCAKLGTRGAPRLSNALLTVTASFLCVLSSPLLVTIYVSALFDVCEDPYSL